MLSSRQLLRLRKPLPDDEAAWEETDEQRLLNLVKSVAAPSQQSLP
jgi:hypothetical protein